MKVVIGLIFLITAFVFASEKKCFAPVVCTEGQKASPEWMQVFPTLPSESERTCSKIRSSEEQKERKIYEKPKISYKNITKSFRKELLNMSQSNAILLEKYENLTAMVELLNENKKKLSESDRLEAIEVKTELLNMSQSNAILLEEFENLTKMVELLNDDKKKLNEKVGRLESIEFKTGNQRMDQMIGSKIDELTRKVEAIERWTEICDIKFENKCFWTEVQTRMSYAKAIEFCGKHGGRPANVYSRTHFDIMMLYLRSEYGTLHCWLGMKFNPKTSSISLADGTPGPQKIDFTWYIGYPHGSASYTAMGIITKPDLASTEQGIHNWPPSSPREGVVCEM